MGLGYCPFISFGVSLLQILYFKWPRYEDRNDFIALTSFSSLSILYNIAKDNFLAVEIGEDCGEDWLKKIGMRNMKVDISILCEQSCHFSILPFTLNALLVLGFKPIFFIHQKALDAEKRLGL